MVVDGKHSSDPVRGMSFPIGATILPDGVNFSVYSRHATALELLLFDHVDAAAPARIIRFDPQHNRTFSYWHIFVPGIRAGQIYGLRAHGPYEPLLGMRYDPAKVLLDPYGRGVAVPAKYSRKAACMPGDNTLQAMKSVIVDVSRYDWEDDAPLRRPFSDTIIYEMHVRGFTCHPNSGVASQKRGTYAGLIEKIPYLQSLGITAVELLPIFQFDPQDAPEGHVNYWGYCPVSFFAPHVQYSMSGDPVAAVDEFRDMVKALHRADIEVILDVVYNHTAEDDEKGPTYSFRGLENEAYYILDRDRARYANYSGTGNTLNSNHAMVRRLILDSLHFWVEEMHVDGFRFDLASILSRDENGAPLANPPILWDIETDPVLAGVKLIAEAWDAAGLYQVGSFLGDHWKEWNGRFRDDIRAFVKSDPGMVEEVASRFFASPDLYGTENLGPEQSINFVTCHDGFTLNDLVSYNQKHNWENGEENRDGSNDNLSWNCGVEGPTEDRAVEQLRQRQIKNFFAITLLSLGVPMLLMGDEVRRTQRGNNNGYCQDNEIAWFDWSLCERHADLHKFVRKLVKFRRELSIFHDGHGLSLTELLHFARIEWHGVELFNPDKSNDSRSLALTFRGASEAFHVMANFYWEPLDFALPPPPRRSPTGWRRVLDTGLSSPEDFCLLADAPPVSSERYRVGSRTVVLLATEMQTPPPQHIPILPGSR
ncbi:glycogen debranching protein GlgX [Caldilinea sp.]|uniref:glycogen debranching protein GlgX n=1 Tax=Caldilinea sp. TaxID=2293560 RepID=UPI002BB6F618|nr:glycogen debranching protein GlgX [Caldilinea sp.]HRA66608.1 glycogen debranching protein GlgX [Caldilinea sp.]